MTRRDDPLNRPSDTGPASVPTRGTSSDFGGQGEAGDEDAMMEIEGGGGSIPDPPVVPKRPSTRKAGARSRKAVVKSRKVARKPRKSARSAARRASARSKPRAARSRRAVSRARSRASSRKRTGSKKR